MTVLPKAQPRPNGEEQYFEAKGGHRIYPSKKVAIVGFASSSRMMAPWQDESTEIWGLNSLYAFIPRWTRWFEIHPRELVDKDLPRAELLQLKLRHIEWLAGQRGEQHDEKTCDVCVAGSKEGAEEKVARVASWHKHPFVPIYMQQHYDDIPASVKWPRDEINAWTTRMWGKDAEIDYFTSTPGQMIATALYEGYGRIEVYGVDLLQAEEYAYQRPGAEYWIGIARGMGVDVLVPKSSALLKANYVYGYSEPVESAAIDPLVKFSETKDKQLEQQIQQGAGIINMVAGAQQCLGELAKLFPDGTIMVPKDQKLAAQLLAEVVKFITVKTPEMAQRWNDMKTQLERLGAQREMTNSYTAWLDHYKRGGKLEGM